MPCARQVVERPAVAQQQRDGDQPWVLADGHAGDRTDESIEFVSDVEFVEEGVDEPTRPREIVCVFRHLLKDREAVTLSLGLIRFRGHLPKGGYDVPTDGRQSQAPAAPAIR